MAIDSTSLNTISTAGTLGPTQSVQLMFAKLQLAMAEQAKGQAMEYMEAVTDAQAKSKEIAEMLQTCRELQSAAKDKKGGGYCNKTTGETIAKDKYDAEMKALVDKYKAENPNHFVVFPSPSTKAKAEMEAKYSKMGSDQTAIPKDIKDFMDKNGLAIPKANDGQFFNSDQWDVVITSLRNHQEQIGSDTQQKMVYIQDFMGQYNSYLQGANSSIQQSNQTLSAIARGQ